MKSDKDFFGLPEFPLRRGNVHRHNVFSGNVARIFHADVNEKALFVLFERARFFKRRVA